MNINPLSWVASAWSALRRLPVAQYIKPLWKRALQEAVQRGGDALQERLDAMLVEKAEKALPEAQKAIDGLQARIGELVQGLPFVPADIKAKARQAVDGPVDELQKRLAEGCASGCAKTAQAAFDVAFDRFQADLKDRIAQL